ncbi:hypothetical protein M0R45_012590 [Rubus argutus]|uniref:Uncharacterized protein n=1 Tax=Rubus argutus TaxID=59490 RepID=A0AAW1YG60_RUBAR
MSGFGQYLLATWKGNIGDDDGVEQTNTSRSNSYLLSRPRALLSPVIENSSIREPTREIKLECMASHRRASLHVGLRPGCRRPDSPATPSDIT